MSTSDILESLIEKDNGYLIARPPFICMVLSTENTVIFVSLFLRGIMLHISKRKIKKFVM